jgi:muramoyltetrapeptide carboxypeptidase
MRLSIRTIAVVAPASIPNREGLERGIELLRSWGYRVVLGKNVHATWRYSAGTVSQRAEDLRWALEDPEIDAVWLARGGFGVQHCLPVLAAVSLSDKMVIGNSDATALLQYLYLQGQRRLIHGPTVETLVDEVDDATRDAVRQVLASPEHAGALHGTSVIGSYAAPRTGPVLGGNITMLASLAGTPWALRAAGSILMLEDITEHAFRLDRSLLQLRLSGALEGVNGIVLGDFIRCHLPPGADYTASELVADLLRPLGVPIVQGATFGHGKTNLPWQYGRAATLEGFSLSFSNTQP